MLSHSSSGIAGVTKTSHQREVVLLDRANKTGDLIDVAVALSRSITKICPEKTNKYASLAEELKSVWKLRNIKVKAVIILAVGLLSSAQTHIWGAGAQFVLAWDTVLAFICPPYIAHCGQTPQVFMGCLLFTIHSHCWGN